MSSPEWLEEALEALLECWHQFGVTTTVKGVAVRTDGALSALSEAAAVLVKHGLIHLDENGNEPLEKR